MVCANLNICLNNVRDTNASYKIIKLTTTVSGTEILPSSDSLFDNLENMSAEDNINGKPSRYYPAATKAQVCDNYDFVMQYIRNKIAALITGLYETTNPSDVISEISKTDIDVQVWLETFNMSTLVRLEAPSTKSCVQMLADKGLITQERADVILNTPMLTTEAYIYS